MKIALVILRADPARGGAERYTLDLACALRDAGDDVTLLAGTFAQSPEQVRCLRLPFSGATRVGRYLRLLSGLQQHLSLNAYDVVHAMMPVRWCTVYHPHAGLAVEAARPRVQASSVAQLFAGWSARLNRRRQRMAEVERSLLTSPRPPVVLCLSQYIRQAVQRQYTLPDSHLPILFNAVNLQRFDPARVDGQPTREQLSIADNEVMALISAQDLQRKGLATLIDAMALCQDLPLKLVVITRQETAAFAERAAAAGVATRVIFAGATLVPEQFAAACDLFVLPTRHDPCSLATLEALAMGKPVISTRFNGACEIMTGGREGFILSDPGDVGALAAGLRRLCDAGVRQTMSRHALSLRPRLAWEGHVTRLRAIYASLAGGTQTP